MKKQIMFLTILLAISINCYAGKTLILMQENGGQLIYIDNYIDNKRIKTKVNKIVDKIGETYVSEIQNIIANDKYSKFIDLSDIDCTREKLLRNLIYETQEGNTVDLYIHGHGSRNGMEFYGGEKLNDALIRSLLTDARSQTRESNFEFKIRLVYMGHCSISHLVESWLSIGAKTALGSMCINHIEFPYGAIFLHKFVNENKTVKEADEEAFLQACLAWKTADALLGTSIGYTNIGCQPFKSQSCCRTINKLESSKKLIGGNHSLKFDPNRLETPLERFLDWVGDTATAVGGAVVNGLASITWAVWGSIQNLSSNIFGTSTKKFKFINYKYKDCTKKYLYYNGTKGSQLKLSENGTVFTVRYKKAVFGCRFAGGYQIKKGGASMTYDNTNNNDIIMEDIDKCGYPNGVHDVIDDDETWYLWNVGNKKYVFYNWGSGKVLDANDGICNQSCSCNGVTSNMINGHPAAANDATQVWILEEQ